MLSTEVLHHFQQLLSKPDFLRSAYVDRLYRRGIKASFLIDGEQVEAVICGVIDSGKLILEINGQEEEFNFRELKYVIK